MQTTVLTMIIAPLPL